MGRTRKDCPVCFKKGLVRLPNHLHDVHGILDSTTRLHYCKMARKHHPPTEEIREKRALKIKTTSPLQGMLASAARLHRAKHPPKHELHSEKSGRQMKKRAPVLTFDLDLDLDTQPRLLPKKKKMSRAVSQVPVPASPSESQAMDQPVGRPVEQPVGVPQPVVKKPRGRATKRPMVQPVGQPMAEPPVRKSRLPKQPVAQQEAQPVAQPVPQPVEQPMGSPQPVEQPARNVTADVLDTLLLLLTKSRDGPESSPPTIIQYCRQQLWWKSAISSANSVKRYEATLQRVLKLDGTLTKGQQQVLELYTRDVCAQHLMISTAVWMKYIETIGTSL